MALGWVLWLGLVGQAAEVERPMALRILTLPRVVRVDEIRQIDAAVADHQWAEAADRWISLLKQAEPEWVVETAGGGAIGFRSFVLSKVAEWPADGKKAYQDAVAEEVVRALEAAKHAERPELVADVLERFPGSGLEATAGWMASLAGWDEGVPLPRTASVDQGNVPFPLPIRERAAAPAASGRYQPLGVISLFGRSQAAAADTQSLIKIQDQLAVVDKRSRVRVYDPSGLVTQDLEPPSSGDVANPARSTPWLLGASPEGETYIAYVTDGAGGSAMRVPWLFRRPVMNDRATTIAFRVVGSTEREGHLAAFEALVQFTPSVLVVGRDAAWIGGYKLQASSLLPMVAKCSLITGEVEWETSIGGHFTGLGVAAHQAGFAMALTPDGRHLAALVAGDHVGLLQAGTGHVLWVKPFSPRYAPGGSPLRSWLEVQNDAVIGYAASDQAVVALDRRDGRTRWTYRPEDQERGVALIGAREGLVVIRTVKGLRALDQATGAVAWQAAWPKESDPNQGGSWAGGTVVAVTGDQVTQWNGLTGERLQTWKRSSSGAGVFQSTDHLLYLATESTIEAFVDERYLQQLAPTADRPVDVRDKRVLGMVAWAKGDHAQALSLAMEVVQGTTGQANQFAQRQLVQWCRAAARLERASADNPSAPSPALDGAMHLLRRSIDVLSGSERALLQWELASIYELGGQTEDAKAVYAELKDHASVNPLIEVAPGTQLNVRHVAALRYERLTAPTLAAAAAAPSGEFIPAWNVALAGSRHMRVATLESVVAVMSDGGGVRGYSKKDGAILWEWKHDEEAGGRAGGRQAMSQVLELPGGGVVQIQGQATFELRVDMNGVTQVMSASSLGPQGGNLLAMGPYLVAVSPYGFVGLDPDTGATKWRQRFEKPVGQVPQLMAATEALVAGWQEGTEMVLMAIRPSTGEVLWKFKEGVPWGGVSLWTPYAFRPIRPILANVLAAGPHLVYEAGTNLAVRELVTGNKLWEKAMNRGASLAPDVTGEKEPLVWADPWNAWNQTSQCLPIRIEKGEPLASVPLPAQSRLIGLTKFCMILLKADTQEVVAMRRDDQRVEWRCPVAKSVLTDGLFWYDGEYLSVLSGQSVKVIHCEDGKEVLSAPIKRGAQIAGVWVQSNIVTIATTSDLRLYTLARPSN